MFYHRTLLTFLIGVTVCILMWQLYILEPSIITQKAGFFHANPSRAQRQYQKHQKQEQDNKSDSEFNLSGENIVSGSHLLPQFSVPNELITRDMNANNNTNYFTNNSLKNSESNQLQSQYQQQQQQSVSFSLPVSEVSNNLSGENGVSGSHQLTQFSGSDETITMHLNAIKNTNFFTNSSLTNNESNQVQAQYPYQQQQEQQQQDQQSNSFLLPTSEVYLSGENNFSESHHKTQISGPDEPTVTPMNAINNTNTFTNSSSTNINYNLSSVKDTLTDVNYEALPKDDISTLIDLHNFEFIINQKSCHEASLSSSLSSGSDTNHSYSKQNTDPGSPLLLILVVSAPKNYNRRLLIRETWGSFANTTNTIRLLFLLAAVNKIEVQSSLEDENRIYSDIVQGNFHDHYKNMTYKHVMALKWFTYFCPNAKYVLKTDDDAFVNTPNLVDFLTNRAARHDLLFCQKQTGAHVRRRGSKWSVSTKDFVGDYYPPYCPGYAILYSPDVAFRLYLEAQKTRYFWVDDVHVTGTLAQQANIRIKSFSSRLLFKQKAIEILAGKRDISSVKFLFTWPTIRRNQVPELWKLVVENLAITKKINV